MILKPETLADENKNENRDFLEINFIKPLNSLSIIHS